MINLLRLINFKRFEDESLKLKPLTLLSGLNGTGKSSTLQSLLLLRQSYQQGLLQTTGLALNGDLVSLGTAKDALFDEAKEDKIGFELTLDNQDKPIAWYFNYDSTTDVLGLASPPADEQVYQSGLFSDRFQYIQAERIGPRNFFATSEFQVHQHQHLGSRGEYTTHFLSVFGDTKIISPSLCHPQQQALDLLSQVEAWLGEISPGTRLSLTAYPGMDLVNLQYSFFGGNPYRSTNVGFGITYVLPILVAVLSAQADALLLIENPEAHLHPKGQAQMGELLARAASCGIQVIVETHSDHVLNGIRLAVHGGRLKPDDVGLQFFQRAEQSGGSVKPVVSPRIDRNGRIDQWPDGFFDEWDKSLDNLLEPAGE
jgi:predicted ATPase